MLSFEGPSEVASPSYAFAGPVVVENRSFSGLLPQAEVAVLLRASCVTSQYFHQGDSKLASAYLPRFRGLHELVEPSPGIICPFGGTILSCMQTMIQSHLFSCRHVPSSLNLNWRAFAQTSEIRRQHTLLSTGLQREGLSRGASSAIGCQQSSNVFALFFQMEVLVRKIGPPLGHREGLRCSFSSILNHQTRLLKRVCKKMHRIYLIMNKTPGCTQEG